MERAQKEHIYSRGRILDKTDWYYLHILEMKTWSICSQVDIYRDDHLLGLYTPACLHTGESLQHIHRYLERF